MRANTYLSSKEADLIVRLCEGVCVASLDFSPLVLRAAKLATHIAEEAKTPFIPITAHTILRDAP